MVRRLSFINSFNTTRTVNFNAWQLSKIDASVNTVYYMRKPFIFRFITKHHRRQPWRRRKHSFEYILYTNILGMWSTEYVFFRKMIKFNYNYCITKSSLLVYNLAGLRSACPSVAKNSENTYFAILPKTIVNYFNKLQFNIYTFWRQPVEASVVISSYYQNKPTDEVFKHCLISPSHTYSTSTIAAYDETSYLTSTDSMNQWLDVMLSKRVNALLLEVYKLHIYLILLSIHQK